MLAYCFNFIAFDIWEVKLKRLIKKKKSFQNQNSGNGLHLIGGLAGAEVYRHTLLILHLYAPVSTKLWTEKMYIYYVSLRCKYF